MGNLISKMNFSVISTKNNKKQEYTTINQNAGNEVLFTTMIQDMANDYSEEESSGTHKDGGGGLRTELNKISTRNEVQESYYLKGHFYPKASDFNKVENTDPTDKFTKNSIFVRSLNKPYAKEGYSSYQLSFYWSSGGYLTCLANSSGINYWSHKQNKSCNYLNDKDVLKVTLFNGKFIAFATTGIYSTTTTNLVFNNQEEFRLNLTISGFDSSFNKHYINFDVFGNTLYASYSAAGLYSSKDGNTWSKVTLPNTITQVDSVFVLNNKLYISGTGGVYNSSDGTTWTNINSNVGTFHNVVCKSGNNVILCCDKADGTKDTIWLVNSSGCTNLNKNYNVKCLFKVGETILLSENSAITSTVPHLYYSNNDGETWNDSGFTVSSGGAITDIIYNPNTELLSLATTDGCYQMSLPLSDSGIHYDLEYLKAIEILRKIDSGETITSEEVANNYILSDCLLRWLGYDPIYTGKDFTKLLPNKYSLTGMPSSGKYTNVVKWGDYIADNYSNNKIKDGMRPYIKFNTGYDTTYKPITILKTENMQGGGGNKS